MFVFTRIVLPLIAAVFLLVAGVVVGALYTDKVLYLLGPCTISQLFGETKKVRGGKLSWFEKLQWRVIDGDTIWCERRSLRMYGYDTPEPRQKGVTKEKIWGQVATKRFAELLRTKSWWTEYTWLPDGRGRLVVRLRNEGKPISATLIEECLARPLRDPSKRPDWCRLPVCNRKVAALIAEQLPLGPYCR